MSGRDDEGGARLIDAAARLDERERMAPSTQTHRAAPIGAGWVAFIIGAIFPPVLLVSFVLGAIAAGRGRAAAGAALMALSVLLFVVRLAMYTA